MTCGSPGSGGAGVYVGQTVLDGFRRMRSASGPGVPLDLLGGVQAQPAEFDGIVERGVEQPPAGIVRLVAGPQVTLISDLAPSPARAAGLHARSAGIRRSGQRSAGPALHRASG